MIKVVLVDDQAMVRAGFRVLLEEHDDIEIVGEASNGCDAVTVVQESQPDVVCMDLRMSGGDGLAATRTIVEARQSATPAVLVVTTFDLDADVFGALEAGADGFILKDCEPEELVAAIRHLAAGRGLVDHSVTKRVITEFARRQARASNRIEAQQHLTPRELEIVRLLAQGMSNSEIASNLAVEVSTVKSHLTRLLPKIDARDRVQAVVWAYRNGVVG